MSIRPAPAISEAASAAKHSALPTDDAVASAPLLRSVTSPDGTTIGYRQFGIGPGLVLLHGSMSSGAHHVELARLLSNTYTVYVPDRRGRGLSGPYRPGDELDQELEDVAALLHATAATFLWGLSSGACIALHAGRRMPAIQKVAIFEPPIIPDRARAAAFVRGFDDEMAHGKVEAAMITAMRGAEMGPAWFRALPKALTARLVGMAMAQEAKRPAGMYPTMRELASTLHADFAVVAQSSGRLDDYRSIRAEVLLMGGSKSPAYLKRALADLAGVLHGAKRVELEGLDHAASWNSDVRGHPEAVAAELRRFFA
jgi:pimeloyl-ACP methyl ester carboxylesterase